MNQLPRTRQSLLVQLRSRSHDAWQEFLEIYERAIHRSCRRRGLQDADADDVTQEVLAAVDRKVSEWDEGRGSFRGWLFRVARNIAVDRVIERSRSATPTGETRAMEMLEGVPDREREDEAFRAEVQRAMFDHAVDEVRPQVRESSWRAFWATAIEGRTPQDVADELGTTVGAVYTAKCRVYARIRKVVGEFDEDARNLAEHSAELRKGADPTHA